MKNRIIAYVVMGAAYVVASAMAMLVFWLMPVGSDLLSLILALFAADAAATVVIWIFGLAFRNSSFYDAYWSLIPWLIMLFVMIRGGYWNAGSILLFAVMSIWSWRLTVNWAYTCKSLKTEDWRYTKFRADNPPMIWHILNFFGINMMPTIFVFLGLVPAIVTLYSNPAFMPLQLIGAAVVLIGTALEFFADLQMHRFRKNAESGQILDSGLWKYSRHPNYLGEITVWLGVYLFLLVTLPSYWYLFGGFLVMVILFSCISIPMMEKRQVKRRPNYEQYRKQTSMLLLLPKKKVDVSQSVGKE